MMEINPDRATEILTRGYRYGENRLVVGAHWQSDTDAARLAASAAYARLHTSERLLEQMKKAREEYKRLKGEATAVVTPSRSSSGVTANSAAVYDLQGRRLDSAPSVHGVYIKNGQKTVIK